jgi:UDP-glucose 4-epimerase
MNVMVTGGAGYIGSHAVYELLEAGHSVVALDDLSTGVRDNLPEDLPFHEGDVGDRALLDELLDDVDAVVHFAGSTVVPESVQHPLDYYHNNTCKTRSLLAACRDAGVDDFLFSSTAAVYGTPDQTFVDEQTPVDPISPYGRSKLMIEWMLEDLARASSLRYAALRYFNVAGADPRGRTGQSTPGATHLIKVTCQAALGIRENLSIFGTDYETRDGTGVRDYIHVTDLAHAHVLALEHLAEHRSSLTLNLGYGHGYSVREVVEAVRRVGGVDFPVEEADRRPGDIPALVADASRARQLLDWTPEHDDLDAIVATALDWERRDTRRESA